ncbi:hypothetical protein M0R45_031398 [Rubus argutus]|uniref:Uncharacterized protein n=1 Tax=Rubus argutus TaxID=59490 RepID=A0AAW1WEK8_RUBAR
MYGLHAEGRHGLRLMKGLCNFVHNVGRDDRGCAAVVAEKLMEAKRGEPSDWSSTRSSSPVIFVDPRDF